MEDLRPRGPGRFVLRALAIASALGFLALLMVQAMAFYAPPPEAPKKRPHLLGPATKAAPVLAPELVKEQQEQEDLDLFPATKAGSVVRPRPGVTPEQRRLGLLPATKAGILGPLKLSPSDPPQQAQGTHQP
jgi:hypothetical protein